MPVTLPGLSGLNPLDFLATLGTLRILDEGAEQSQRPRLAWEGGSWNPILHGPETLDVVADTVAADCWRWRDAPLLQFAYPKVEKGGARGFRGLRVPVASWRAWLASSLALGERSSLDLFAALASESAVDQIPDARRPSHDDFAAVGSPFDPAVPQDQSTQPTAFDFQERTGFPLTSDERIVGLDALDTDVKSGILHAGDTLLDWLTVRERISASAHANRRAARVVRVFSDQPVYIYKGFALLPDPTKPDAAVDVDKDWNVDVDCNGGDPDNFKSARCVSLHRDHVQNRSAIALVLVARTIIVRGENATGGMSLVTMSESLHFSGDATIDLSARQDAAPTFGIGQSYPIFADLIGSPGESKNIDDSATATIPGAEPGPANPWYYVDPNGSVPNDPLSDLQ